MSDNLNQLSDKYLKKCNEERTNTFHCTVFSSIHDNNTVFVIVVLLCAQLQSKHIPPYLMIDFC